MIVAALVVGLACTEGGTDSGIDGEGPARCELAADNSLRATCTVVLELAATATLTLTSDGAETRTFTAAVATEHELLAWGLLPETTYSWSLADETGSLTTGSVPDEFSEAEVTVTGSLSGFDALLQPLGCGGESWFVMFDGQGRIIWYQRVDEYGSDGRGYDWAQETRSLMFTRADLFLELDVRGNELLRLEQGTHFDHELHHDVSRWGDYTYLLLEYQEGGYNLDQVDVFEGTTRLGSWRLADSYDVASNPNNAGEEWSHGNALNVSSDGEIIFSSLSFDALVALDADPTSPTFLEQRWMAAGSNDSLPDPDYVPAINQAGFVQQHAAHRVGDELWLFDNLGDVSHSRGLRLGMQHTKGQLVLREEWPMETACPAHGGAYPLSGGGMVATCATPGDVWAFGPGESEPEWTLNAWCDQDTLSPIRFPKGIPIMIE